MNYEFKIGDKVKYLGASIRFLGRQVYTIKEIDKDSRPNITLYTLWLDDAPIGQAIGINLELCEESVHKVLTPKFKVGDLVKYTGDTLIADMDTQQIITEIHIDDYDTHILYEFSNGYKALERNLVLAEPLEVGGGSDNDNDNYWGSFGVRQYHRNTLMYLANGYGSPSRSIVSTQVSESCVGKIHSRKNNNKLTNKFMSIVSKLTRSEETKALTHFGLIEACGGLSDEGQEEWNDYIWRTGTIDREAFIGKIIEAYRVELKLSK